MSQPSVITVTPSEQFLDAGSKLLHRTLFVVFLISFAIVWLKTASIIELPGTPGWPETVLLFSTLATTLLALSRQLPGQNVLLAAALIALIPGLALCVNALTGIPFGLILFTDAAGPRLFNLLPWSVPIIWVIIVLNSRGVARLILRPWRKSRLYGFRLIGVTAVLSVALDLGLEPFATRIKDYWLWQPTKLGLAWQGMPITNALGWIVTTLLTLAFVTPVLINKSHRKYPPDYHPLLLWLLLGTLFITGAVKQQMWASVAVTAVICLATSVLAVRGARW